MSTRLAVAAALVAALGVGCGKRNCYDCGAPMVRDVPPSACTVEVSIPCTVGSTDGCAKGVTTHHVCIPETATAGPPCEQELASACPAGQYDACTRAVATTHVCVLETVL